MGSLQSSTEPVVEKIDIWTLYDLGTRTTTEDEDSVAERVIVVAPGIGNTALGKLKAELLAEDGPGAERVVANVLDLEDEGGRSATLFVMSSQDFYPRRPDHPMLDVPPVPDRSTLEADLEHRVGIIKSHLSALAAIPAADLSAKAALYYMAAEPQS